MGTGCGQENEELLETAVMIRPASYPVTVHKSPRFPRAFCL
jgi:hypothetical protein